MAIHHATDRAALQWPAEARLLVACARVGGDARLPCSEVGDWDALARMARAHGVLPLVSAQLLQHRAGEMPAPALASLRAALRARSGRILGLAGELVRVCALLEGGDVPVLAYKGPTLAALAYQPFALRDFADLDLLVRPQDVGRACELLQREGYRLRAPIPMTRTQDALFRRFACELCFRHADRGCSIDLHWAILPKVFAFDAPGLWRRSMRIALGGCPVATLSPEDLFLIACVHNAKHRWERLGWIRDIAGLVRMQAIDWDAVCARARASGTLRIVRLGIYLAADLLDAPVPHELLQAAADRHVRALARHVYETLFAALPHNVEEPYFFVRARERLRDRATIVLRAATTPTVNELALVALPRELSFLYYGLRPLRMAAKYLLPLPR
jgi:hypothetical protein